MYWDPFRAQSWEPKLGNSHICQVTMLVTVQASILVWSLSKGGVRGSAGRPRKRGRTTGDALNHPEKDRITFSFPKLAVQNPRVEYIDP